MTLKIIEAALWLEKVKTTQDNFLLLQVAVAPGQQLFI